MVFLWFSYGFRMVPGGFPMAFLWFSYGSLWFAYGFPKVFLWFSYGFPMVFHTLILAVSSAPGPVIGAI